MTTYMLVGFFSVIVVYLMGYAYGAVVSMFKSRESERG